ncbi:MAG: hypothetical protein QM753_11930 [Thermomicrobiales bacterium]
MQPIVVLVPIVIALGFWGWMFSDMEKNAEITPEQRQWWRFAFLFGNVVTAAFYFGYVYLRRS